jgi:predicted DNA binding CopG/RHH family protein
MKKKIKLLNFKNEDEERAFWSKIDLADYFDSKDLSSVSFPNLKPSSRAISIRLPETMFIRLKEQANELHIPYQSLIKQYLARALKENNPNKAA